MGLVAPTGALAALSTSAASSAASVAPSVAPLGGTLMPGLVHAPLLGKHLLSTVLGSGLRNTTTNVQSSNWAGYADIGDTFQTLSSSWVQPTVNCTPTHGGLLGIGASRTAYSSFWVGLDGYSSSSVEQTGTDSDCSSKGTPNYYAWYEMYPASSVQLPAANVVYAGDTMYGMVMSNSAGTDFYLQLYNATRNWTYSVHETGSGYARSSAEFVAEAPSQCSLVFCSELPLANFGTVNFSSASVATTTPGRNGTIGTFNNADIQMASNGKILATPGPLNSASSAGPPAGSAFSVKWNS
jgi:hypothetical protein